jgi:hypothetical protein
MGMVQWWVTDDPALLLAAKAADLVGATQRRQIPQLRNLE